ncbi:hypothetical protein GNF78_08520, partial [Clostridium perfringens]
YIEKPGKIIIEGVDSLTSTEYTPIYDRIEPCNTLLKVKGVVNFTI